MATDYDVIFRDASEEPGRRVAVASGALPPGLDGTLIRNGGGKFHAGDDPLHFFDAYGFVATLRFADGVATYTGRFVKTPLFVEEEAAGRQVRRRPFGNLPGGRWKNFLGVNLPNPVMHDALAFAGRLHATDDPGWFRLDPTTLETMSEYRLDGRAGKRDKMAPVPRIDRHRDRLVTYRVQPNPVTSDRLTFYEIDPSWTIVNERAVHLELPMGLTHEVSFTERFFGIVEPPMKLARLDALAGVRQLYDCLEPVAGRPAKVHLVSREGAARAITFALPGHIEAMFHVCNAYDDGDAVVMDAIGYAWPHFDSFAPPAHRPAHPRPSDTPVLRRYRLDLASGTATASDLARGVELPRTHPDFVGRPYRYAYLAGVGPPECPDPLVWTDRIVKVDVNSGTSEEWHVGPARWVSQPAFAPRKGSSEEDDGWVLVWVLDGERCIAEVVVLDARHLTAGPVATLDLGAFLPLASHSRFEPSA